MASAEFNVNEFDFEIDELDNSEEDSVVITISMEPKEAEIRKEIARRVDGVQFNSYSSEEFEETLGERLILQGRRAVGRTQAVNWEKMEQYSAKVKPLIS